MTFYFANPWLDVLVGILGGIAILFALRWIVRPRLKRFEGFLLGAMQDEDDPRDFEREVRMAAGAQPAAVDLTPREPPIWNQGRQGSCVGFATAAAVQMQIHANGARNAHRVAPRFLYWTARLFSGDVKKDTGTTARGALKGLDKYGYTFEPHCPYNDRDFKTKPTDAAFEDAARHRNGPYRRVARTLEAICAALAEGDAVLIGMPLHANFKPDRSGVIPMPAGSEQGGHEMLIVGYDKRRQAFRVRNSWGTDWGDKGRCWLKFDHVLDQKIWVDLWTIDAVPK